jgi:hypothetical protein
MNATKSAVAKGWKVDTVDVCQNMDRNFQYKVSAELSQFYLEDDVDSESDTMEWTREDRDRLLAVAHHTIAVGTDRDMEIPVSITVHESRPAIAWNEWGDHISAASLEVTTGRIVVSWVEGSPSQALIEVEPGVYEAIMCYNLASLGPDGLEGGDSYHIHLFPGRKIAPVLLKKRPDR